MSYKRAMLEKGFILIQFPYNRDLVNKIKELEGRKWVAERNLWSATLIPDNVEKLESWGFSIDESLVTWLKGEQEVPPPLNVPTLKRTLFDFQKDGVGYIEARKGRVLVADEMGLGKTLQSLAYLELHPELRPACVICPASLKYNWEREIHQSLSKTQKVHIASGKKSFDLRNQGIDIVVINYDIVDAWLVPLRQLGIKLAILDEGHKISNPTTLRSKATIKVCRKLSHVIGLTGTPVINRPGEIFTILNLINPNVFNSRWNFIMRYCDPKRNGFGWDFSGSSNTVELNQILRNTVMIRRLKKDVLKQLPPKMQVIVPIELSNLSEYKKEELAFVNWVVDAKGKKQFRFKAMEALEKLKQKVVEGKMKKAIEWIDDWLESGEKLVVFATHTKTLDKLEQHFGSFLKSKKGKCVRIDGSTSIPNRQKAVDAFQSNPNCTLFIGNILAAGEGITLTAASRVAFLELAWTVAAHAQAGDRVHRIGQDNPVTIYYLIAHNTVEEHLAGILDSKRRIISEVVDGVKLNEEQMLLNAVLNVYLEKADAAEE